MNILTFGVAIAVGYQLGKDQRDLRASRARINELEKENRKLRIREGEEEIRRLEHEKLYNQVLRELPHTSTGQRPPWLPDITC